MSCLENCTSQLNGNPNPLDLRQWDFLVASTAQLDTLGDAKSVTLSKLHEIGAAKVVDFRSLPSCVERAAHGD